MPVFSYKCEAHGAFTKFLKVREKTYVCPKCNASCKALIKIGTVQVVERLDNGAMARTVERLHNIEEIMNERADKHTEEFNKNLQLDDGNDE